MSGPDPEFKSVPLEGLIVQTPIRLVQATSLNHGLQIVGAIVGCLGAALFGAGLGPLITSTDTVPKEVLQVFAKRCSDEPNTCGALALAQSKGPAVVLAIVGGFLVLLQIFMLWWTASNDKSPTPKS